VAAHINKRQYDEEIDQYGMEVFQQAENVLRTKYLVEGTISSIPAEPTMTRYPSTPPRDADQMESGPKPTRGSIFEFALIIGEYFSTLIN